MEEEKRRIKAYNYLSESLSSEEMKDECDELNEKDSEMARIRAYDDDYEDIFDLSDNDSKDIKNIQNKNITEENKVLGENSFELKESGSLRPDDNKDKNSINISDNFLGNNSSNIIDANEGEIITIKKRKNKKKENNDEENNINNNDGGQNKKNTINLSSTLKEKKRNIKNIKIEPNLDDSY